MRVISIHAPRVGCDAKLVLPITFPGLFQSTHPVWGATHHSGLPHGPTTISIHAPRVGCDALDPVPTVVSKQISIHAPRVGCDSGSALPRCTSDTFQSTHPVWGATFHQVTRAAPTVFQSTHPVWGATQDFMFSQKPLLISIHAPRVGCDSSPISSPCDRYHFNPRTPCGVRRNQCANDFDSRCISIHAPRVGCDVLAVGIGEASTEFQSTHPVWGATMHWPEIRELLNISIHAPRVGCDWAYTRHLGHHVISIHAPRVGCDHLQASVWDVDPRFQSTHPVWGATNHKHGPMAAGPISIHAPRVGCDLLLLQIYRGGMKNFNPRTPCGVRHGALGDALGVVNFNPRTPCGVRQ